jgi:hypothetical protein
MRAGATKAFPPLAVKTEDLIPGRVTFFFQVKVKHVPAIVLPSQGPSVFGAVVVDVIDGQKFHGRHAAAGALTAAVGIKAAGFETYFVAFGSGPVTSEASQAMAHSGDIQGIATVSADVRFFAAGAAPLHVIGLARPQAFQAAAVIAVTGPGVAVLAKRPGRFRRLCRLEALAPLAHVGGHDGAVAFEAADFSGIAGSDAADLTEKRGLVRMAFSHGFVSSADGVVVRADPVLTPRGRPASLSHSIRTVKG